MRLTVGHTMANMKNAPYPDHMILKFLETPLYWEARIREAAKQQGFEFSSVRPLAEVCEALRTKLSGAS